MRKRLLVTFVSLLLISSMVFLFASCDDNSSANADENVTVVNGIDGKDGEDGREVEFNVSSDYIQWRYVGETTWKNLVSLESLKGEDGKDGEDGQDGKDGKDGRDGISIYESGDPSDSGVGIVANTLCTASVARIYMYESSSSTMYSGLASAFLITDYSDTTPERYLVTNAHCCRYIKKTETIIDRGWYGTTVSYSFAWTGYEKILCYFENDDTAYTADVLAYGSYDDSTYDAYYTYYNIADPGLENDQADLAILKITGTQPSNDDHPSLKIASNINTARRGDSVAIIGNPEGMGSTNSIAVGAVSQTGITISSWGAGSFTMTDAAINGGNSGGPMVDTNGRVVGVVESKLVSSDIENMGFALDSDTLIDFISWVETQNSISINYTLG